MINKNKTSYADEQMENRMRLVRNRTIFKIWFAFSLLIIVLLGGFIVTPEQLVANPSMRHVEPSLTHLFGTDWLGRDMLARTLKGLHLSFLVGFISAILSTLIAVLLSFIASLNKYFDFLIVSLIDFFLSVPHLVMLILIVFVFGGGVKGVIIAIALTHWPTLTRILRAEILQIKTAEYVKVSHMLGKSHGWIFVHHYIPLIVPQLFAGFVMLFPHAILHEASITFLGFGLSPEQPAIGIILAESMKYLSMGMWWLALFPGLLLVCLVNIFDMLGRNIKLYLLPNE